MSIKSKILSILEEHRNTPISGESIASNLNISRAYVWKTIRQLKEDGYEIIATPNLGYMLGHESDVLSKEGILLSLNEEYKQLPIYVYDTIDSTNNEAKKRAVSGACHGTVVVSNEQSAGRGRRGRNFYSPKGSGIYISFVLRPELNLQDCVRITTAASVAVSRAIEKTAHIKTQIKWVNDLFYEGKKVCGILTEAVTDCDTGCIDSIILGIGVNVCMKSDQIPFDLKTIAGSLFEEKPTFLTRNQLCAHMIHEVLTVCTHLMDPSVMQEYKEKSLVLGKHVLVHGPSAPKPATAMDIDCSGGLTVQYDDGQIETLHSGEISIRMLDV